jgi:hypothetical protein
MRPMSMGKIIIIIGAVIVLVGVILQFAPQLLSWFGKLPGDIRYEKENTKFFFPITTMILVSVILSLLLKIFGK